MIHPRTYVDYEALSQRAASWLSEYVAGHPQALVCLATGSSPRRTYELIAERGLREPELFAKVRWLKLDEWGGLPTNDPATCEFQLQTQLISPLDAAERYVAFASAPSDPAGECQRIQSWLVKNGPIDVAILGLGVNGHLGFNEPAEMLQPHAHVAELTAASLGHVMVQGAVRAPRYGLTLGMADLLHAREILLLVSGEAKREPLARLCPGNQITTQFPASLLQCHPRVTLLCDRAALGA